MSKSLLLLISMTLAFTSHSQEYYMIAGTYTHGKSNGIYVYAFNSNTGKVQPVDSALTENPSYLAISKDSRFVYAVNELGKDEGGGRISAFALDPASGKLKMLNSQSSMGDHPCYITIDNTGKWVIVGNYSSGTVAVLPIMDDGRLGQPSSIVQHMGSSVDKKRQEGPHVHATVMSFDNTTLFVPDLGLDQLFAYDFNEQTGDIEMSFVNTVTIQKGAGPRHFDFHPGNKWGYLLNELSGTVNVFEYHSGKLKMIQSISALPDGFSGNFTSADIHVSPDGRFLYASTRDESNTIAIFKINSSNGKLELAGHQSTLGKTPRNFSIDPSGKFLFVANQNSDNIVVFHIDKETGLLTDSGEKISIGNPVCIKWAEKQSGE